MAPNSTNSPVNSSAAMNGHMVVDEALHSSLLTGTEQGGPPNCFSVSSPPKISVAEFYRDRSLLITGATGFMGKVLVEKLLRSCSAVGKIYLLMRPRGNKDVNARLQDLLNSKVSGY